MTDPADPLLSTAVLIGNSSYDALPQLPAVANNVSDLSAALRAPENWGLPPERCVELCDERDAVEVITELARIAGEPLDTLLVYFAGHGVVDPTTSELILATGRTTSQLPRLTGLRYSDVREILRVCRARRLLLILDCCFSGRATGVMADPSSIVSGQLEIEGTYVLCSTGRTELSKAPEGDRHTAFTGGLLEVIANGVPSGRAFITPGDLFDYTQIIMAREGRPRPTQSHDNRIRELPLMRNPWSGALRWLSQWGRPQVKAETGASDLVVGIHVAVSAVRPAFGPTGPDCLTELEAAIATADPRWLPGMELVRDVMTAMRREHGDGAATAAIVVGELFAGIHTAVRSGARWEEVVDRTEEEAAAVLRHLAAPEQELQALSAEQLGGAVATALGNAPEYALVMAAVARVGADRVEIATGPPPSAGPGTGLSFVSRLSLDTSVLVPNSSARPVALHEPYVLVAPRGDVPVDELQRIGWRDPGPLLIIAPGIDAFALSSLHSLFATMVVVRPTDAAIDWDALCARTGYGLLAGRPLGRAGRALVTPSSTTVLGLPGAAPCDSGRLLVHAGPVGGAAHTAAVRALTVARSAGSGVLPGAGTGLYRAGRALGPDAGPVRPALTAPLRQLVRNAGRDADEVMALLDAAAADTSTGFEYRTGSVTDLRAAGVLDPVATARGVVQNAVAAVSRYVATL
ncbi:TCP-1/cpn60 chaperonin family protein [Streptomyces sp. NPDC059456]|uniref:caspase, EACC1-associated type n=1 Tax=Streptomyces sp. NPDC059456 TaxID=3346838 RepID=UPI0036A4EED2